MGVLRPGSCGFPWGARSSFRLGVAGPEVTGVCGGVSPWVGGWGSWSLNWWGGARGVSGSMGSCTSLTCGTSRGCVVLPGGVVIWTSLGGDLSIPTWPYVCIMVANSLGDSATARWPLDSVGDRYTCRPASFLMIFLGLIISAGLDPSPLRSPVCNVIWLKSSSGKAFNLLAILTGLGAKLTVSLTFLLDPLPGFMVWQAAGFLALSGVRCHIWLRTKSLSEVRAGLLVACPCSNTSWLRSSRGETVTRPVSGESRS